MASPQEPTNEMTSASASEPQIDDNLASIKNIISQFYDRYNDILAHRYRLVVSDVRTITSAPDSRFPGIPVHILQTVSSTLDEDALRAPGVAAFPSHTPAAVVTAVLHLESFDMTVHLWWKNLAAKLKEHGAEMEWLVVDARPKFIVHYADETNIPDDHSAFCITTKNGEKYALDFQVEKFGYSREDHLMELAEYLSKRTTNGRHKAECDMAYGRKERDSYTENGGWDHPLAHERADYIAGRSA